MAPCEDYICYNKVLKLNKNDFISSHKTEQNKCIFIVYLHINETQYDWTFTLNDKIMFSENRQH